MNDTAHTVLRFLAVGFRLHLFTDPNYQWACKLAILKYYTPLT